MNQLEFNQMLTNAINGGALDDNSFKSQFTGAEIEAYLTKMKNAPTGSTTMDAEVIDIRTGYNGKVHPTAGAAVRSIAAGLCNPNLLDNWYFGNPVNQRGQTEYTGAGYTIDRWLIAKIVSVNTVGTLLVEDDGIRLIGGGTGSDIYLRQKIADIASLRGKTVTLSFLIDEIDGTWAIGQYGDASNTKISTTGIVERTFVVSDHEYGAIMLWNTGAPNGQIKIRAAKLELGDQQTLARLENGNWVLNEVPNYAEELAKCQRYQYVLLGSEFTHGVVGVGSAFSETDFQINIPTPTTLRAKPTPTLTGSWFLRGGGKIVSFNAENVTVTANSLTPGMCSIVIRGGSNFAVNQAVEMIRNNNTTANLILDANL